MSEKPVEFNLMVVETPETASDRAQLVKDLTEGQLAVDERASESANYSAISQIAERNKFHCQWFGTANVYIWPKVLGPDPVEAFKGMG